MSRWTSDEIALLLAFYPHSNQRALFKLYCGKFSFNQIRNMVGAMQLRKTERYYQSTFGPKNIKPWNKDAIINRSYRLHPVFGKVRTGVNGNLEYQSGKRWLSASHKVWQMHHGKPVPKDMVIRYADGDKLNVEIDNLVLVKRAEIMQKNSFSNYPKEVRECMLMNKKIKEAINERQ